MIVVILSTPAQNVYQFLRLQLLDVLNPVWKVICKHDRHRFIAIDANIIITTTHT